MTRHWPAGVLAGFVVLSAAIALPATAAEAPKAAEQGTSEATAADASKAKAKDASATTAADASNAKAKDASKAQDNPDADAQTTEDSDAAQTSSRFDYNRVVDKAEALAAKPYSV